MKKALTITYGIISVQASLIVLLEFPVIQEIIRDETPINEIVYSIWAGEHNPLKIVFWLDTILEIVLIYTAAVEYCLITNLH